MQPLARRRADRSRIGEIAMLQSSVNTGHERGTGRDLCELLPTIPVQTGAISDRFATDSICLRRHQAVRARQLKQIMLANKGDRSVRALWSGFDIRYPPAARSHGECQVLTPLEISFCCGPLILTFAKVGR